MARPCSFLAPCLKWHGDALGARVILARALRAELCSLCLLLFLIGGCTAPQPERAIDEQLLASLGLAQSYQHQADELVELGQRREAIARVQKVLEIPFPADVPEAEDVSLDAHGRIAELQLEEGDLEAAEAELERGLNRATRVSYFKARLFNVKGRVLRARAAALREANRAEEAREVSRAAIGAFERSIEINQQVLGMNGEAGAEESDGERENR